MQLEWTFEPILLRFSPDFPRSDGFAPGVSTVRQVMETDAFIQHRLSTLARFGFAPLLLLLVILLSEGKRVGHGNVCVNCVACVSS